jgi:orotate phosphoribosyltransferase-like protein
MSTADSQATQPIPADPGQQGDGTNTGPQRVLALVRAGLAQSEIATRMNVSQSTVSRWYNKAKEAQRGRRRAIALVVMCVVLTACAVVTTIAVSVIAFAQPG